MSNDFSARESASYYWKLYGLDRDPFSSIREDAMTCIFPEWETNLDLLQHLI
jgi:hypothetical protein